MKTFSRKIVIVGSVVAGVIGVIALAGQRSKEAPPKRVALIGDSYAVGLGPELEKSIPTIRGEAYVGATTAQWVEHLRNGRRGRWIPDFRPTDVLVSLGVNDGGAPKLEKYNSLVQALHGMGARVTWIAPPPGVNTPARQVIASLGVPVIEATSAVQLAPDGLHPLSYAGWAREIATAVSRGA